MTSGWRIPETAGAKRHANVDQRQLQTDHEANQLIAGSASRPESAWPTGKGGQSMRDMHISPPAAGVNRRMVKLLILKEYQLKLSRQWTVCYFSG